MDFGVLPPEINSGRMYSGPGSGPMLAAAAAWDGLAAQLHSTAQAYSSVITGLTVGWQGPSSSAMAAAAAPYTVWMNATAAQAEQTAAQARAAAAAYETAFAATVPPPVVATNRAVLGSLLATNVFGQNTAAIAATEAQYEDMWAQDAAAMYGYAGQSATASQVTPFSPPPQTTNPDGLGAQSATGTQAAGTSAGTTAKSVLSQLTSQPLAVPSALQSLAAPTAADPSSLPSLLASLNTTPLGTALRLYEFVEPREPAGEECSREQHLGFRAGDARVQHRGAPSPACTGSALSPSSRPDRSRVGGIGGLGARRRGGGVVGAAELGCGHPGGQTGRHRAGGHQPCCRSSGGRQPGRPGWSAGPRGSGRERPGRCRSPRRGEDRRPRRRPQLGQGQLWRRQGHQNVGKTHARPCRTLAETGVGATLAHRQGKPRQSAGAAVGETRRPRCARVFTPQAEPHAAQAALGLIAIGCLGPSA